MTLRQQLPPATSAIKCLSHPMSPHFSSFMRISPSAQDHELKEGELWGDTA